MKAMGFKNKLLLLFVFSLLLSIFQACKTDDPESLETSRKASEYTAEVPLAWFELLIEIDRYAPNYRPPAAARMMAYTGLAGYEATVNGMPEYNSLGNQFPGMALPLIEQKEYYWPACANAAYAKMFRYFYPHIKNTDLTRISALENKFNEEFYAKTSAEILERSTAYGELVADAIYEYSRSDVYGHEAYKDPRPASYFPPKIGPKGEKLWQPTWPDYTPALFPYWGKVKTFAMKTGDLKAKPPIDYSEEVNSRFYQQAMETKVWVDNSILEDKWIAEFWSDDFYEVTFEPAARLIAIGNQMVVTDKITLDKAVELYAKMGMAMSDAAVAIWGNKYVYNVRRPIEYIREIIDPNWKTILNNPYTNVQGVTPEFPAYPSGHSGFGSSGGLILTNIFGDNRPFTDNCHQDRYEFLGTPRTFTSFVEAGLEDAYSRIRLGVHYRMDCDEGVRLGNLAATRVISLPWRK